MDALVSELQKLSPGFLPAEVFYEFTRLVVTPIVFIVPLRIAKQAKIEILLTRRAENDPHWPGKLHIPGTVLRATDHKGSFSDAFDRILNEELLGIKVMQQPTYVGTSFDQVTRGSEIKLIHWVEVMETTKIGEWFSFAALPEDLIITEVAPIQIAVKHFQKSMIKEE